VKAIAALLVLTLLAPWPLAAQCPDGTPPPCGRPATPSRAMHPNGVAVLYLSSLSSDTTDAAIADGLTEDVIARLSQVQGLRVPSRYAVQQYRGRRASDPRLVSRELGVKYVLDGSVRRVGARLRVVLLMTDASAGFTAWGETYDRSLDEIFSIEDSVAVRVAQVILGTGLTAQQRAPLVTGPAPTNAEAYQAFLRGRVAIRGRTAASASAAIADYRQAIAIDPRFARAWAGLAHALSLARDWGWHLIGVDADSVQPLAARAAAQALALDSTSADSWLAAAMAGRPDDARQALRFHRRALAADSTNIEALHQLAWGYLSLGEMDSAIAIERRVPDRDPYYAYAYAGLGEMLNIVGRPQDALAAITQGRAVDSTLGALYWPAADAELRLGRLDEARRSAARARAYGFDPFGVRLLEALVALKAGDTAAVRVQLPELDRTLLADSTRAAGGLAFTSAGFLSGLHAQLGDAEGAAHWARRVPVWTQRFYAVYFARHWFWAPVRDTPVFRALLAELGAGG